MWSFCYAKAKNVPAEHQGKFGYGDVCTRNAIDADSKLVVCWHVGRRDARDAAAFMREVADRLSRRVQLTTDGHHAYLSAVYLINRTPYEIHHLQEPSQLEHPYQPAFL
jgi:transposase-like protein